MKLPVFQLLSYDDPGQEDIFFMLFETVYDAPHCSIKLSPYAIFVDTNVWVSAFDPDDDRYDYAQYFLENATGPILVPICVVVETWGMLVNRTNYNVGKSTLWERGIAFLAWLADPGHNVRLVPEINDNAAYILDLSRSLHVDCVDAMLANLSNHINVTSSVKPFLAVASADRRDFPRIRNSRELQFRIYDIVEDAYY